MKTITILRHAKTEMHSNDGTDHNRELNHRGLRDREIMASIIEKNKINPEIILCSTAVRARKTISSVAKDEWILSNRIIFEQALYLATEDTICTQIAALDEQVNHVMICAHNPGLTDFVNEHTDLIIDNLPTCGLVTAKFHINKWPEIFSAKGTMQYHLWPKLFI